MINLEFDMGKEVYLTYKMNVDVSKFKEMVSKDGNPFSYVPKYGVDGLSIIHSNYKTKQEMISSSIDGKVSEEVKEMMNSLDFKPNYEVEQKLVEDDLYLANIHRDFMVLLNSNEVPYFVVFECGEFRACLDKSELETEIDIFDSNPTSF